MRLIKGSHILVPRLCRATTPISCSSGRRPRRLRHALWRPQPDRHHRHPGRHARGCGDLHAGRDRLSLRRRECLFRRSRSRPADVDLVLCRRPLALRRRRGGGEGRHPRLSSRAGRRRPARNCSRCSAARSPPPATSPPRRWTGSASPGLKFTATSPLPGGNISSGVQRAAGGARRLAAGAAAAPPRRAPTARASRPCSATPIRSPTSAAISAPAFTRREVRYLIDTEFARTAEDILWRRTKLGLVMTKAEQRRWRTGSERPPPRAVDPAWRHHRLEARPRSAQRSCSSNSRPAIRNVDADHVTFAARAARCAAPRRRPRPRSSAAPTTARASRRWSCASTAPPTGPTARPITSPGRWPDGRGRRKATTSSPPAAGRAFDLPCR